MSSAKKANSNHPDNSQSPEEQDESTHSAHDNDRRWHPDSKTRDRRVIERFSDPQMRSHARMLHRISHIWTALAVTYLVLLGGLHATKGLAETTRSLFYGVVVISITVAMYRMGRAANSFQQNESKARLSTLVERVYLLLFIICIVAAVMGGTHLVTLF